MDVGNINWIIVVIGMNDVSSRFYVIFIIKFIQVKFDFEMLCEIVSKIYLVDFVGSECVDVIGVIGVRLKEGGNINKFFVILGNVIFVLVDLFQDVVNIFVKKKLVFVFYRDFVLIWLLKDSFGGNFKIIMIVIILFVDVNYGEILSIFCYVNRVKNIINKFIINEDVNVKFICEL